MFWPGLRKAKDRNWSSDLTIVSSAELTLYDLTLSQIRFIKEVQTRLVSTPQVGDSRGAGFIRSVIPAFWAVKFNSDGALDNSGNAASGGLIRDHCGNLLVGFPMEDWILSKFGSGHMGFEKWSHAGKGFWLSLCPYY
ncbi:hypothetical protein RHMOL_Rhmol10G0251000 [Rhododendron molle]|uniref:Uncharacterized protein n=1 Tax=Rhododendron molle TaxID=49168 RepID=A0ACC0M717_RHOML|nr:hypothetical protein RHMOL_Rhmol10G0251000 [Rhododendron molle]